MIFLHPILLHHFRVAKCGKTESRTASAVMREAVLLLKERKTKLLCQAGDHITENQLQPYAAFRGFQLTCPE